MGGVWVSGRRVNDGGAVGDSGGIAMAEKESSSQVDLGEFCATLTNDTSYMRLQLIFNTTSLLKLQGMREVHYIGTWLITTQ